jgi:hypothetical protein
MAAHSHGEMLQALLQPCHELIALSVSSLHTCNLHCTPHPGPRHPAAPLPATPPCTATPSSPQTRVPGTPAAGRPALLPGRCGGCHEGLTGPRQQTPAQQDVTRMLIPGYTTRETGNREGRVSNTMHKGYHLWSRSEQLCSNAVSVPERAGTTTSEHHHTSWHFSCWAPSSPHLVWLQLLQQVPHQLDVSRGQRLLTYQA